MNELPKSIIDFIDQLSSISFESLLGKLFEYQFTNNAPYQRLCISIGKTPDTIGSWMDIPEAPASAFRLFDLSCVPLNESVSVFHSSGTTADRSSRHWMDPDALQLYEFSLSRYFNKTFPQTRQIWAVMPSPQVSPHSSLSHMLGTLEADYFAGSVISQFSEQLLDTTQSGDAITLFGTAIGLSELMKVRQIVLPQGSVVIETGGFKGRNVDLSRPDFYSQLRHSFGVDDDHCYGEYGMCELGSQFYSRGAEGAFTGPAWSRTRCIDPLSGADAAPGTPGLLRHYDLANLNSVAVVQTQDRAIMAPDGSFHLAGRATDAELRGCSLTAEELWSK